METSKHNTAAPSLRKYFWILLIGFTFFRIVIAGCFGLGTDEAHYALYGRNLAWGYFDHPPLVGFLAALTTLPGESLILWRLGPILCWSLAVSVLRLLILELFDDERIALWSLVLLMAMPVQHLLAVALLPDATLNLFWCTSLLAAWLAFSRGHWRYWILTGVSFGAALMSKYHGILLPMCLGLYALTGKETRRWLWSPKPYVAGVFGLLVFLPNILWNMHNDWISYAFQLGHGGGSGYFSVGKLFESIGGQVAAGSPVIFALLIAAWIVLGRGRHRTESHRFIFWTSLPVFIFFCGIGLTGKVLPHWPAVGWWTGVVVIAAVIRLKRDAGGNGAGRWRNSAIIGVCLGLFANILMYVMLTVPVVKGAYEWARQVSIGLHSRIPAIKPLDPYEPKIDITNDVYGWKEIAQWVEAVKATLPEEERDKTFIFFHRFFNTSQTGVYVSNGTVVTSLHRRPSQYRLWFDAKAHTGWSALFVDNLRWQQGPERYGALFERCVNTDKPVEKAFFRRGQLSHTFQIYHYQGFRGKVEEDTRH